MSISPVADIEDIYELSPLQYSMLFYTLLEPGSGVFCEQQVFRIGATLNHPAFEAAWRVVIAQTPALRTSFHWEDLEKPVQVVHQNIEFTVPLLDWRALSSPSNEQEQLQSYLEAERKQGFPVGNVPLMRITLMLLPNHACQFVWTFHHILLDGWSWQHVIQDVAEVYQAILTGREPTLPVRPPYADYIGWVQNQNLNRAEHYWRQMLQGFSLPTSLRLQRSFPSLDRALDRVGSAEHVLRLFHHDTKAIHQFIRTQHLTLSTLLQGAWSLVLSRYSGELEVLFGSVVSGRPAELNNIESMVGLLINTLPMRIEVCSDAIVETWLQALQAQHLEARQYEYTSMHQIRQWSEVPVGVDLFESIFIVQNFPLAQFGETSEATQVESHSFGQTNVPLSVMAAWSGDQLQLTFVYHQDRYTQAGIEQLATHYRTVLLALIQAPKAAIRNVSMLQSGERQQVVEQWNDTTVADAFEDSIIGQFEARCDQDPDATAFCCRGQVLTYAQLNDSANCLAKNLVAAGVGSESVVGVHVERSLDWAVCFMAILKAGAVYLPLDPSYPEVWLLRVVEEAEAAVVLTGDMRLCLPAGVKVMEVAKPPAGEADDRAPNLGLVSAPHDLAYIIYTSGSTGRPKGIEVEHQQILNRLAWMWDTYPFAADEVCSQKTAAGFVDSIWELLGGLLQGLPTVIITDAEKQDPNDLIRILGEHQVTRLWLVPTLLEMMLNCCDDLAARLPKLTFWVSSGEPLSTGLYQRFHSALPHAVLYNLYGTSEVWDATWFDPHHEGQITTPTVPIGRPIWNMRAYVLDRNLEPLPIGLVGELWIGGVGLARGYLHDDRLNRERFVADRFSDEAGAKLYRTGDLARFLPNGNLEFLGRADQQINVGGNRVEPAEIEAAVVGLPGIREALVTLVDGQPQGGRLVLYVVAEPGPGQWTSDALGEQLADLLPSYMRPTAVVWLEALPTTPSGKRDRKHLPIPRSDPPGAFRDDTPANYTERTLSDLVGQLLSLPGVPVQAHLFNDLGFHSLLATRLLSQVRDIFNVNLDLRIIFESPTIRQLAQIINTASEQDKDEQVESILTDLMDLPPDEAEDLIEQIAMTQEAPDE